MCGCAGALLGVADAVCACTQGKKRAAELEGEPQLPKWVQPFSDSKGVVIKYACARGGCAFKTKQVQLAMLHDCQVGGERER